MSYRPNLSSDKHQKLLWVMAEKLNTTRPDVIRRALESYAKTYIGWSDADVEYFKNSRFIDFVKRQYEQDV